MFLKTCIVLNWNSQDLKIDEQPLDILPAQLLLVFVRKMDQTRGFQKYVSGKAKVTLFSGNYKALVDLLVSCHAMR